MINSIIEAFHTLDTNWAGIPFEAIEYLRCQSNSPVISSKIVYALSHAHDGVYYDPADDCYTSTPLWYAIVAETHLFPELIDPVIGLFTDDNDDRDLLFEQGEYLIGLLAERYPDKTVPKVFDVIEDQIRQDSDSPYLYLFDALYYADIDINKNRMLEILKGKKFVWLTSYANHIADLQIKEAVPIIADLLNGTQKDMHQRREYEFCLKQLESGKIVYPDLSQPYSKYRKDWKEHYEHIGGYFNNNPDENDDDDWDDENDEDGKYDIEEFEPPVEMKKTGRNEPCPCGSGLKYKKCCLAKDKSINAKDIS